MDWTKVANFVKTAAPILGTCIGGPVGTLAGGAVSLIASAFGVEDAENPEAIYNAISADPEAVVKLKQIELDNKTELQRIALQKDEAYLKDTQSARDREVEIVKATGKKDINLYVLAWTIVTGFFGSVVLLTFVDLPETSSQAIFLLCGALIAGFGSVMNYFFGTTKSSGDKTTLLAMRK